MEGMAEFIGTAYRGYPQFEKQQDEEGLSSSSSVLAARS
jgi:hypothetical protein